MDTLGIDGRLSLTDGDPDSHISDAKAWGELGATTITISLSNNTPFDEGLQEAQQIANAL
jgi:hypothetical protein